MGTSGHQDIGRQECAPCETDEPCQCAMGGGYAARLDRSPFRARILRYGPCAIVLASFAPLCTIHFWRLWENEQYQHFPIVLAAAAYLGWLRAQRLGSTLPDRTSPPSRRPMKTLLSPREKMAGGEDGGERNACEPIPLSPRRRRAGDDGTTRWNDGAIVGGWPSRAALAIAFLLLLVASLAWSPVLGMAGAIIAVGAMLLRAEESGTRNACPASFLSPHGAEVEDDGERRASRPTPLSPRGRGAGGEGETRRNHGDTPGSSLRECGPVWLLLWLVVPPPFQLDQALALSLQRLASVIASAFLDLVGCNHVLTGHVIEIPGQRFLVEEACSGIRSLFAIVALVAIFVVWQRRSLLHSLLLIAAAPCWAVSVNVFRVCLVVLARDRWNADLASGAVHTILGVAVFLVGVFFLFLTDRLLLGLLGPDASAVSSLELSRGTLAAASPVPPPRWRGEGKGEGGEVQELPPSSHPLPPSQRDDGRGNCCSNLREPDFTGDCTRRAPGSSAYAGTSASGADGVALDRGGPLAELESAPADRPALALRSSWLVAACFGLCLLLQAQPFLSEFKSHDLSRHDAERLARQLAGLTLPDRLGAWTRNIRPPSAQNQGERSLCESYAFGSVVAEISVAYPFLGWHELTHCYRGSGWVVDSWRRVSIIRERGDGPTDVEVTMTQPHLAHSHHGYLLFSEYDADGEPFLPPRRDASLPSRLWEELGNRLLRRTPGHGFDRPTCQLQVLWTGAAPPTPDEQTQTRELYAQARSLLQQQLKARTTEAASVP